MGLEQVGHRYTMQRLIREFEDQSEKDLYKAGAFNASQAELDYVASSGGGKSTRDSGERDVTQDGFEMESPLGGAGLLGNSNRQQSADIGGADGAWDAERGNEINPLHDVTKHKVD